MSEPLLHVTFVCSGNICRSPMAEKMFAHQIRERGLADVVRVSSAGTGGWHAGDEADDRRNRQREAAREARRAPDTSETKRRQALHVGAQAQALDEQCIHRRCRDAGHRREHHKVHVGCLEPTRGERLPEGTFGQVGRTLNEQVVRLPERAEVTVALQRERGVPGRDTGCGVHPLKNRTLAWPGRNQRRKLGRNLGLGVGECGERGGNRRDAAHSETLRHGKAIR